MVPHLAEECWAFVGSNKSICNQPWPQANKAYLVDDNATVVIQINGKRRGEVIMPLGALENEVFEKIENIKNIKDTLNDKVIVKSIYVPNKILNIVIKQ